MGLKQDIVVKNEFSEQDAKMSAKKISNFIYSYMVNLTKTECSMPLIIGDSEYDILKRYTGRAALVDKALSNYLDGNGVEQLKHDMADAQGKNGIAFCNTSLSMSHDDIRAKSNEFEKHHSPGKTVQRIIISFRNEYLKEMGVIPQDFPLNDDGTMITDGDGYGQVDQLKLRFAFMNAMNKISNNYDDMQYIGTIHLDQGNVHAHIAIMDFGEGVRLMPDGAQKGKMSQHMFQMIRRGVDTYLDEHQSVKALSSSVESDKQNVLSFIRRYTTQKIADRGTFQFIMACLPEDRRLWRASTNRREMRRANILVRDYVENLLQQDDSGYDEAMHRVRDYADYRTKREGLSDGERDDLIDNGRERIVEAAMNSVYTVLRKVSKDDITMSTPFINQMSVDYSDLTASLGKEDDDLWLEFGYKFRSYKSRLDHHRSESHKYHDAVKAYEHNLQQGLYDEQSRPLLDFFKIEEEYNEMLTFKYYDLLPWDVFDDDYAPLLDDYREYKVRVNNMRQLVNDEVFEQMLSENAEQYALSKYNEVGGHLMVVDPNAMRDRLSSMEANLISKQDELAVALADYGKVYDEDTNRIISSPKWSFEDVKGLDLHVLEYDFSNDVTLPQNVIDSFTNMATKRYNAFTDAKMYLERTHQEGTLSSFPVEDIELQHKMVLHFKDDSDLPSQRLESPAEVHDVPTLPIDYGTYAEQELEIRQLVRENINSLQYE